MGGGETVRDIRRLRARRTKNRVQPETTNPMRTHPTMARVGYEECVIGADVAACVP